MPIHCKFNYILRHHWSFSFCPSAAFAMKMFVRPSVTLVSHVSKYVYARCHIVYKAKAGNLEFMGSPYTNASLLRAKI